MGASGYLQVSMNQNGMVLTALAALTAASIGVSWSLMHRISRKAERMKLEAETQVITLTHTYTSP